MGSSGINAVHGEPKARGNPVAIREPGHGSLSWPSRERYVKVPCDRKVARRKATQRHRRSVRGCIVDANLSVLHLIIIKKGDADIPGLTDTTIPRRLGPKRAGKIRKLFNLNKDDDVRQYVVRRPLKLKEGQEKPKTKAPKIQRLITPIVLQRARRVKALKRARIVKSKADANEYAKLLALRQKEKKERKLSRRRSSASLRESTSEKAPKKQSVSK